jgi:hypothetical protein
MNRPWFHAVALAVYIVLAPVSWYFGWLSSVTYVSFLSIWALVESRLSSLVVARGFKEQNEA